MSLSSTTNRIQYTGNNSTTIFAFPYLVYDATHLQVYLDSVLQASGYTVDPAGIGSPSGTTVTFSVAPGTGVKVTILRVVPTTQPSIYDVAGAFPAKTTEKNFDLTAMRDQQHSETLARAVTLPVESSLTAANLPDPGLAANFGKGVKIKADGTGLDTFTINAGEIAGTLTTKGDLLGYSSAVSRIPVGTNGRYLEADSTQGLGLKWSTSAPVRNDLVTTKGDLIVATGSATPARKAVGSNGRALVADSSGTDGTTWMMPALRGYLHGLTLSNNGADPTNDIDIAVGEATAADFTRVLTLGSALTKRLDATWVTGTNQGGRSSSQAIANGTWHVFLIRVAGVDDVGFDTSVTGANLVTDHSATHVRRIGSVLRESAALVAFSQNGNEFLRNVPVRDVNNTADHTTAATGTLSVPVGLTVTAMITVVVNDNGNSGAGTLVSATDIADTAPSITVAPGVTLAGRNAIANVYTPAFIRTSTSATIRYRATHAAVDTDIITNGWRDTRGRLA